VVVRRHREKLGDVRVEEGGAVGRWLGVVSRAVVGAVARRGEEESGGELGEAPGLRRGGRAERHGAELEEEDEEEDVGHWNVVQNNGDGLLSPPFIILPMSIRLLVSRCRDG